MIAYIHKIVINSSYCSYSSSSSSADVVFIIDVNDNHCITIHSSILTKIGRYISNFQSLALGFRLESEGSITECYIHLHAICISLCYQEHLCHR